MAFAVDPGDAPTIATTYESVRWRPRHWRNPEREDRSSGKSDGFSQIHAGFLDPDGDEASNLFVAGFRAGGNLDKHVQMGLGVDWGYQSQEQTEIVSREPLPGGGTTERRIELARSSSHLFPVMANLQVTPGDADAMHPYFGIGGGYEWLFLNAEDFVTGDKFDATYGGWGWQAYAGLAIPLSHNSSINVEGFRNTAKVERDVADPISGQIYKEQVDLAGFGLRAGLGWGF
jgi:opacity protein-like surface antigen